MDMLEELSGNRVNYAMVTIGGARRDISDEMRSSFEQRLDKLQKALDRVVELCVNDKTVALRTKGVGVMTTEEAVRMGAVGPHARASGVDVDVRRDSPYCSYGDFEFKVPGAGQLRRVRQGGRQAAGVLREHQYHPPGAAEPAGRAHKPGQQAAQDKEGVHTSRHEAPRGQLIYQVVGDGGFNNHRVSIHVPSYKNTPTVPVMLRNNTVADAGLIIASIDPCFSCLDR